MTKAAAPSASGGHSIACSGSQIILEASTFSTVSSRSLNIALGLRLAHLRSETQTPAMSSGVEPVSCM